MLDDLQQIALILRPAPDVVDLAPGLVDLVDREHVEPAEVASVEQVADLSPVSVDGERAVLEDGVDEVRDPSLILCAVLVSAIDAALAQNHSVHVEAAGVVPHVLVGRPLAAAVWTVEVDWLRLFTGLVARLELSIHLVRRGEHHRRLRVVLTGGFEEVQRASSVDLEVRDRVEK